MLTQAQLKKQLHYDPLTGIFTKLIDGKSPGGKCGGGYIDIYVFGKKYKAHRLAWLYMHGKFPVNVIDHINGIRTDNRLSNIRECTQKQNCANSSAKSNNKTGFKGVVPVPSRSLFKAQIRIDGVPIHLGYFPSAIEASNAYQEKALSVHGEYHRKVTDL